MAAYLSTSCFPGQPVADAITACRRLGRNCIEISAPHPDQPLDQLTDILAAAVADGIELTLHNYFPAPHRPIVLNIASGQTEERSATLALIANAAKLVKPARAKVYAVHAGYVGKPSPSSSEAFVFEDDGDDIARATARAIQTLAEIAPWFEDGTRLAIENLFPSPARRHSLMCDAAELGRFMDAVPSLGWLLDLGHLNVSSALLDFSRDDYLDETLARYGHRLVEVHLSENDGSADQHRPIEVGSWQLTALRRIIQTSPDHGERVYCVETRRADRDAIVRSLELVDEALG